MVNQPNIRLQNHYLRDLPIDYLYHLGLDTSMDLSGLFGDTKYVCMFGSPVRAKRFAIKVVRRLHLSLPSNEPEPLGKQERFSLYKVGPVISVSHGMGMPSTSILLNEITKLLEYANCEDFRYIRIGTSGGIGVNPGSVIISTEAVNEKLQPIYEITELGKTTKLHTRLDNNLIHSLSSSAGKIPTFLGKTMSANSFYEGQGRLDGALEPRYTENDKIEFLHRAYKLGVRNIEMEASIVAAFCSQAKIPAAVICATLLNRLEGDQITSTPEQLAQFSDNAERIVLNMITQGN